MQAEIRSLHLLVDQLLTRVTVLEGRRDSPIEILESPVALPVRILLPAKHRLVPIEDLGPEEEEEEEDGGVDLDEVFHLLPGDVWVEGEDILDVLRRRNLVGDAVPEYEEPPEYNNPGFVLDH